MAYAGTISFADGTVMHQWLLIESSSQLAEMCVKEGLSALCDAKAESRRKEVLGERLPTECHISRTPTLTFP